MLMEEDSLTALGRQLAELNKQFLDDETFILITGDNGKMEQQVVNFDDIDIDYDVIASGTATDATVNKEVRKGQLIQLLNVAINNPNVNQTELLKQIFKEFDFKNFEDMIQVQPQTPPMGGEVPTETETPEEMEGLYPQMGGVGGMAQYLQNPNVQPPTA